MTFPMTSTDIWRSLWWPIYCCHFVCVCSWRAICQCIVYRSVLTGLLVAAVLLAVLTSGAASAATGQSAGDDDDDGSFNCNCLVARQLGLAYHVCDTWLPQFNASQLTTLCRSAASIMWMKCKCQYSLYTSLFTNMVAHKKKIPNIQTKSSIKNTLTTHNVHHRTNNTSNALYSNAVYYTIRHSVYNVQYNAKQKQEVKVIWQKAPHGGPFPG